MSSIPMVPNPPPGKQLLIAVIDDHEPFRTGICRLLERRGYATRAFDSIPPFIASRAIAEVDCLILDVGLPEIDGLALQECLRYTNYQFPIIFCTGQELDDRLRNALANGASALLQKPVSSDILIEAVEAACAARREKK